VNFMFQDPLLLSALNRNVTFNLSLVCEAHQRGHFLQELGLLVIQSHLVGLAQSLTNFKTLTFACSNLNLAADKEGAMQ